MSDEGGVPPGRTLDAQIALLMGWKRSELSWANDASMMIPPDEDYAVARSVPHYSSDVASSFLVVEKMCEMDLGTEYANALHNLLWPTHRMADDTQWTIRPSSVFRLLAASPEQVCRAALEVASVYFPRHSADED